RLWVVFTTVIDHGRNNVDTSIVERDSLALGVIKQATESAADVEQRDTFTNQIRLDDSQHFVVMKRQRLPIVPIDAARAGAMLCEAFGIVVVQCASNILHRIAT